jgi:hypothetical protein
MLNTNVIYSAKGHPLYTKIFMDISSFYIKDGELLKNRGDKFKTKLGEIMNFNNIVVEENGFIEIFCDKEKEIIYNRGIEALKKHYINLNFLEKVKIISG